MKLIKAIAATACALALATAAQATTYTDSSENYPGGEGGLSWDSGANGGEGFGAWSIETTSGSDGWAGFGIWNPEANEFKGTWEGKSKAFGMIGKGSGFSVKASRAFRAALATGDSFQLDMGVNWDANIDGAHKGFVLTAGGKDIIEINHGNYPGHIYVNGDDSSDVWNEAPNTEEGDVLNPMTWKFTAKDATTLTVSANSRKDASKVFEKDFEVTTSAIDGFRLQSIAQDNQNEDRRQSYYDNFVLDVSGELMDFDTLTLTEDSETWAITTAEETALSFTLTRTSTDGEATVAISSSDSSFVSLSSETVTFEVGSATATFTGTAKLSAGGQVASISASGTGFNPLEKPWEVKGPSYDCNAWEDGNEEPWLIPLEDDIPLYVNNYQASWFPGDDSKVTVVSEDESVITVAPAEEWKTDENDGHTYASWTVSSVAPGQAKAEVLYDGVKVAEYGFTVPAPLVPGFELSGPQTVKPGQTYTYTLKATLQGAETGCSVSFNPVDAATADPSEFNLRVAAEDGFYYREIEVTFGENPCKVTLSVASANYFDDIDVTIKAPVDPSKFDDFIAYDDASLYDGEFDMNSLGAGSEGFQKWGIYKTGAEFGGVFVGSDALGFPEILTEEQTIALYANGGGQPDYAIFRPFVNDLQPGQKASVEFVVPESTGTLYVQFARVWEGVPYSRFEVYSSDYNVGVNINGAADDSKSLNWSTNPRRIVVSIQRAADGSDYTINLLGYNEGSEFPDDIFMHVVDADVGEWYDGIQGIVIGAYNMGGGENMPFNKLAITQEEEPVKIRAIGFSEATWNPDVADVPYTFAIGATTTDIGIVALSVSPDDGGLTLSTDSVDLTDIDEASFTVTVSADAIPAEGEGTKYTITASPADATVKPATYDVTPRAAFIYLTSDNWEYNDDQGAIWVTVHATPSNYGNYYVTVDPAEGILEIPELSQTITINAANQDACAFDLKVVGAGDVNAYITHEGALEPSANFHFLIHESPDVEPVDLKDIIVFAKGSLTVTLPEGGTIMTTTNLVTGTWVDYPAEVGEDRKVVIPTTGPDAFFRIGEPPAPVADGE